MITPMLCFKETKAVLAILIYSSVLKSNKEDLEAVLAKDGIERNIFRSTILLRLVLVLLARLRFNNAVERDKRKQNGGTAAISWVFKTFI